MKRLVRRMLSVLLSEQSICALREFLRSVNQDLCVGQPCTPPQRRATIRSAYKLNIGCGSHMKPGWCNIDLAPTADMQLDVRNGLPFEDSSVETIYCEHFLEHLEFPSESMPFLAECLRVLRPGGCMHIGVPNSRYVVESCLTDPIQPEFLKDVERHKWAYPAFCRTGFEYINYHFRLGGRHKFAFDWTTLKAQLEESGFVRGRERAFDSALDTPSRAPGTLYAVAEKDVRFRNMKESSNPSLHSTPKSRRL